MSQYMNEKLTEYKSYLSGKTCGVIGIGISNIPLIDFILSCGARVIARDKKSKEELSENLSLDLVSLEQKGVRFICGDDYLSDITEEVVFKTPGLRYDCPEILKAYENGSQITGEMEAFLSLCPCKIIAVTGSDGKTTTTTLIAEILKKSGYTVHLGGNIGKPLLPDIDKILPSDFAVIELSSFQLYTIGKFENRTLPFASVAFPDVAVITNVSPNHLDWHKSFEEYAEAKTAIFASMKSGGKLVTNEDFEITRNFAKSAREKGLETVTFSSKSEPENGYFCDEAAIYKYENGKKKQVLSRNDILLPGVHNAENYMAAISATEAFAAPDAVKYVALHFGGVEHRLELVRKLNGVRYYNSSIDSSPSRTLAAISGFPENEKKKLILIMGGYDKHIPFDVMGEKICDRVKAVFLNGPTMGKIRKAIENADNYRTDLIDLFDCRDFDEAVLSAHRYAKDGDIVILSPACASFDAFKNFEERGKHFKNLINSL